MAHIIIDKDNRCTCDCASACIKGKTGSSPRCTEQEIRLLGHTPVKLIRRKWFKNLFKVRTTKKINNI